MTKGRSDASDSAAPLIGAHKAIGDSSLGGLEVEKAVPTVIVQVTPLPFWRRTDRGRPGIL